MKKFITLTFFLFLTELNFSQSWTFKSGGNPFDGKYKTASVIGSGSGLSKPLLVVNKFEKESDINLYVTNLGYYSKNSDLQLLWAFDNNEEEIYLSSVPIQQNETFFLKTFLILSSKKFLSKYSFIEKLKSASSVSLRIKNGSRTEDFKFSLKGSTKAIDLVIPAKEFNKQLSIEQEILKKVELEARKVELEARKKDSIQRIKSNLISSLIPLFKSDSSKVVQTIPRDNFIGERIKFLIDFDNKYGYQTFSKKEEYGSLGYEEFKGRIARFVNFRIKYPNYSIESRIYKLVMEDNGDTIHFNLSNYQSIKGYVGFISILEEARKKYVGKTFYFSGMRGREIQKSGDIQECLIKRIEFAEKDVKYAQLYGAYNVFYEVGGEEEMINVNFSESYLGNSDKKYDSYKDEIFERIFYTKRE